MASKTEIAPNYQDSTARLISKPGIHYGPDDFYHRNVQQGAKYLVDRGYWYAVYAGQWSSGTTLWRLPGDRTITVTVDELEGRIK